MFWRKIDKLLLSISIRIDLQSANVKYNKECNNNSLVEIDNLAAYMSTLTSNIVSIIDQSMKQKQKSMFLDPPTCKNHAWTKDDVIIIVPLMFASCSRVPIYSTKKFHPVKPEWLILNQYSNKGWFIAKKLNMQ